MNTSQAMVDDLAGETLIQGFEGDVLHVYHDQAGLTSIGIGHKLTHVENMTHIININGVAVDVSQGITEQQSMDLLFQDLQPAEDEVNLAVQVELNQNQFDACVSLTFNIGDGGFASSSVLRQINAGNFDAAAADFALWNKITVNGQLQVCQDLVDRRAKEAALFSTPC